MQRHAADQQPLQEPVALGAHDHAALELRIRLLLAFSERHPETEQRAPLSTFPVATALLIGALSLPHHAGTLPLDILHTGAEQTLGFLLP